MKPVYQITLTSLLSLATAASLAAQISINVSDFTPNSTSAGILASSEGSVVSDKGMPMTSYTVSNLDFTSLGGGASESFTFSVSYTATTDGSTTGTPQFNGFGNVSVTGGDNNQVDGAETLTATIALDSSTFAGLSLDGFFEVRAGGVGAGETGTFSYDGGFFGITEAAKTAELNPLDGITEVTLSVDNPMNFEGFRAQFTAVPEPSTYALIAGTFTLALIMIRRRRRD